MFRFLLPTVVMFSLLLSGCRPEKPIAHNTIRVSTDREPQTFDPRLARDFNTVTFIHLFYDGLTRSSEDEETRLAVAKTIDISPDQKTYTFTLRPTVWSDGTPLTAKDFQETWLSMLDPSFSAPNAYQLFLIKGAKEAKEGKIPLDEVGIKAPDDSTLIVELNQPTPYFLQLTSSYFLSPVSPAMRQNKGNGASIDFIGNGPYVLSSESKPSQEWLAIPNPHYWDGESNLVLIVKLDNSLTVDMFDQQELDWAGSPLSTIPTETISPIQSRDDFHKKPAASVFFLRLNTSKPPFDNPQLRKAFSMALNRKEMIEHVLPGCGTPAHSFVPAIYLDQGHTLADNETEKAKKYFKKALKKSSSDSESFPILTLCYGTNPRHHKVAQVIQHQWKETFDIDVQLQCCEPKILGDLLTKGDYQISIGSWFADIPDPISFLEIFKLKNNGTNHTGWENGQFIELLEASCSANDPEERQELLKDAERILMQEMPIIPLYFNTYNYLKNPSLKGVYFSETGYLDFKNAYFE